MQQTGFRAFAGGETALSDAHRGTWLLAEADGLRGTSRILAVLDILHGDERPPEPIYLRPAASGRFRGVFFSSPSARAIRLRAFGRLTDHSNGQLSRLRRIGSAEAALRLLSRPSALRRFCAAPPLVGAGAWKNHLRETQAAVIAEAPTSYADWLATFATWSADDIPDHPRAPRVGMLVFAPADDTALGATLNSVGLTPFAVIRPGQDWRPAARALVSGPSDYVGLLGAGEILTPHALQLARSLLPSLDLPEIAIADEDRIDERGHRTDPVFKPEPNHALILSGTLSRGLWLVRADALVTPPVTADTQGYAELARLDLWLSRYRAGADVGRRLPYILVSRRRDAHAAPPSFLSRLVDAHLALASIPFHAVPSWPIRLQPNDVPPAASITAIVPSILRAPHTETCLRSILSGTGAPGLDLIVAVSQPDPLDASQRALAARLTERHSRLRVIHCAEQGFNFARTVNRAAIQATGTALLLLNDDVSPLAPDWLARMHAHLADPRVGVVGARLVYPGGTLQHAGIVMGLAGFCEHAFRHEPAGAPGYAWRAQLPQRLSAVTGACLLIDRVLWNSLGGMDEAYPSAYNDVDLCLRADEVGREVVLSDATLVHHELQTYGAHYAGDRAAFMPAETARMRARWSGRIGADPFYSPNLDLWPGREWRPAFPPRL